MTEPKERSHRWNPFKHKGQRPLASARLNGGQLQPSSLSTINAVYYPNWKVYKKQPPSTLNLQFITHIFYAFAWVRSKGDICFSDGYADIEIDIDGTKGALRDLKAIKQQYPHIKTVLSVGGGGEGSKPFPNIANSGIMRSTFAQSARNMIDAYGLDGIDVDWEHPSTTQQGHHYTQMLSSLRKELPAPKYLLTSALPAGEWALQNIDLAQASKYLDFVNLMCYDFAGPWTDRVGHQSQLFTPKAPQCDAARTSCDSAVTFLLAKGVLPGKILLGVPTYGRSFLGARKVGDVYSGLGGEEGVFEYKDLPRSGAEVVSDAEIGAVHSVGGDGGFVTYDDPRTVKMKAEFVRQKGLGGLFYWTGTGDKAGEGSLVETGWRALRGP